MPRILEAAARLEQRGLRVSFARNIDASSPEGYLAGSDEERAAEINRFFRDPSIDAFFFARGGYGAMRILDALAYDAIAADPRPVIGFSDVTALHGALARKANVGSFHGPMLNLDFYAGLSPDIDRWFWSMLAGDAPLTWPFSRDQILYAGEAEGELFGGCLSLTTSMIGTPYDHWVEGGIWFWEEVGEQAYRLDRMLTHLRLSGRISRLRGVVIGKLKDCGDDEQLLTLFSDVFGSLGIPVVRDLPFGHHGDNLLMPIGARVRLSTSDLGLTIQESPVVRS